MENASQALIIAGAILLAILLIAIGMFIFNQANKNIQEATEGMDKQTIAVFNGKFELYQNKTISGTQMKALVSTWATETQKFKEASAPESRYLDFKLDGPDNGDNFLKNAVTIGGATSSDRMNPDKISGLRNDIKDLARYEVKLEYNGALVKTIVVKSMNK